MSVTDQQIEYKYVADGNTTVFPFHCRVLSKSDIIVLLDGVVAQGFDVDGINADEGGNVVFNIPPRYGCEVLILRDVKLIRETDYQTNGDFLAKTVNLDFDRIWMSIQGVYGWFIRALRYPIGGKHYNAESRRIENLDDPVNEHDATTKKYVDATAGEAKQWAEEAKESANDAHGSATESQNILDEIKRRTPVLTINHEGPDEDGNIDISKDGALLVDAPKDHKIYGRGDGQWIAIGDTPDFTLPTSIRPLADVLYIRSNIVYQIPLVSVGFDFSANLTIEVNADLASFNIPPALHTNEKGYKYIVLSAKESKGSVVLTLKDDEHAVKQNITMFFCGGVICSVSASASYEKASRTIKMSIGLSDAGNNGRFMLSRPKISVIKLESRPNSLNQVKNNGRNVTFTTHYTKDALGQMFMGWYYGTNIDIRLDSSVKDGVYVVQVLDQYSGLIFERFVNVVSK